MQARRSLNGFPVGFRFRELYRVGVPGDESEGRRTRSGVVRRSSSVGSLAGIPFEPGLRPERALPHVRDVPRIPPRRPGLDADAAADVAEDNVDRVGVVRQGADPGRPIARHAVRGTRAGRH